MNRVDDAVQMSSRNSLGGAQNHRGCALHEKILSYRTYEMDDDFFLTKLMSAENLIIHFNDHLI